jgi:hypothetical protein
VEAVSWGLLLVDGETLYPKRGAGKQPDGWHRAVRCDRAELFEFECLIQIAW